VSSSGKNTLGYGKTKAAIHEAHKKGMTLREASTHYGITYASAYGAAVRSGLKFRPDNNRAKYGHVKLMVIYEANSGLTLSEIAKKHNLSMSSVRNVNIKCQLGIKGRNKKRL
jgi:transposase